MRAHCKFPSAFGAVMHGVGPPIGGGFRGSQVRLGLFVTQMGLQSSMSCAVGLPQVSLVHMPTAGTRACLLPLQFCADDWTRHQSDRQQRPQGGYKLMHQALAPARLA